MEEDVRAFASWDVDYVKLDGCYAKASEMEEGYKKFGALLNQTGRPMVYSCSWPAYQTDIGELVSPPVPLLRTELMVPFCSLNSTC